MVLDRKDVPAEQRWNMESVYATPELWDEQFEQVKLDIGLATDFEKTLTSASNVLRWLSYSNSVDRDMNKLLVYAVHDYSTNSLNTEAARRMSQIRSLVAQKNAAFAFAVPELNALGFDAVKTWMGESEDLALYQHYFEKLEHAAEFTLSADLEAVLAAVADPFDNATSSHGVLANTDLVFPDALDSKGTAHAITQSSIRQLLGSTDRTLRQSAYETYADTHLAFKNTMASLMSTGVKQNNFVAKTRGYDSALHAALAPLNLPFDVFHNLIDTFKANLPVWHRYWQAKRKMLKVDTFNVFDTFAPMTNESPEISFKDSVDWLCESLAPLGQDYVDTMRRGSLEEGWVDWSLNKGKRMGAFSNGRSPDAHPFIMMSYTPDVFGMSTLAHELGHSMHSYYSNQTQPLVYSRYSLFAAEVASNFNQAMLRAYLFEKRPERSFQIALIEEAMANFYRYFFVMPTLARFELEIHERNERGEALSAGSLNELMASLYAEGYGGHVNMNDDQVGITWAQFHTHIYSRFYVYQYATGISGANVLAQGILSENNNAVERYRTFLNAGGSKYPLDALKAAGVDLSKPKAVEDTFKVLESLVQRLESLAEDA